MPWNQIEKIHSENQKTVEKEDNIIAIIMLNKVNSFTHRFITIQIEHKMLSFQDLVVLRSQ